MKKTRKIAITAIATALGCICLLLAQYSPVNKLSLFALAQLMLFLPLSQKIYKYSFLAYLATATLAFFLGAVLPSLFYLIFFGVQSLALGFMLEKKYKPLIRYLVIAIYAAISVYIMCEFFAALELFSVNLNMYLVVFLSAVIVVPYHHLLERIYLKIPSLLGKLGIK